MPSIDVSLAADSKIVVASCYTFRAHQDFVHLLFIAHTGSMAPHSSIAIVYRARCHLLLRQCPRVHHLVWCAFIFHKARYTKVPIYMHT